MRRWPATLRGRLTLWYTIVLGVPLVAFAEIGYLTFASALHQRTEGFIGEALTAFTRELAAERRVHDSSEEAVRTTVAEVRFRDLRIEVRDASGRLIAVSEEGGGGARRVVERDVTVDGDPYHVRASYPQADEEAVLERIRVVFLLAVPILLVCAGTGGFFLASRGLRPVGDMAARAMEISASTLHERLPVSGGEELTGLARVVNALLDRLEAAFEQQRRFMADASHELRTPTAIVRTETEVTLSRPHRDEAEYRASLEVVQDASRRLTRIVDDLFLLARADAGHLPVRREPLYLEEVVHDGTRGVLHLAAQRGVTVELHELAQAPMQGDPDLLGRLLLNLLDNAIKHSPHGGVVEVRMAPVGPDRCAVSVVDHGPGIPVEAQDRIFERFFGVESARDRGGPTSGAGLGLAIAKRICELHGGTLELVESRPGRTEFRFTLPIPEPVPV